jgi:hypothetical protein
MLRFFNRAHGAYFSGIREAQKIVEELKGEQGYNDYDPSPQFCDEAPGGGLGNPFILSPHSW